MKYEVQNRNDFLTGAYLIIRIPENELDQCTMHTIQADRPDFIIPFHYKSADGHIEFVYKIGTLCKLHYFSGELNPREYTELWQSILKPLLDCADWFMNPCSFVLSMDCLYYDKNEKAVRYVYVPSAYGCSGYDSFYKMAVEISKTITVSDALLENKVLKAIIEDFNPVEFLQMLKDHTTENMQNPADVLASNYNIDTADQSVLLENETDQGTSNLLRISEVSASSNAVSDTADDIFMSIEQDKNHERYKKERETGGYKIFSRKSKKKRTARPGQQERIQEIDMLESVIVQAGSAESTRNDEAIIGVKAEIIDITQSTSLVSDGPGLRYVGRSQLPPIIQIVISEGEIFTIGRFDATIGKKQSNFEFDKKTRAVSRRHAVIERDVEGYKIVDLSSSAGTFVNDKKLPPNTPHGLETGCRVSFGNSGADYVWEVS